MIINDTVIRTIAFGDMVEKLSQSRNVSIEEARTMISEMSFTQYLALVEDVPAPSGQTISPTGTTGTTGTGGLASGNAKSTWAGKGAPLQPGMTVGLKGPGGVPIPGQVSQVDTGSKGAKIKNPTTGQDEWVNIDDLQPFMAKGGPVQTNTQSSSPTQQVPVAEDEQLARLKQLAGIQENCSGGATGAGAIAIAPAAMGKVKRRQETNEQKPVEYTRTEMPKTIVGDTKPAQASGELSANLAARGQKTANRVKNGARR